MMLVAEAYLVPLIVALLIGVVVAYWTYRSRSAAALETAPPPKSIEAPLPQVNVPPPIVPQPAAALDPLTPSLDTAEYAVVDVPPEDFGPPDNLQTLKGVGAKFAAALNANGITRFDQLARLGVVEIGLLDERMGAFKGRLTRDRVIEQAAYLARDDRAGFEAEFGKLGSGA